MDRYRVLIVARAEAQVREIDAWWRVNRTEAQTLFVEELAAVLERLASAPLSGSPYTVTRPPGVRRVLLRRTRHHAYYTVDERAKVVTVRAVWHASRGARPTLR